MQVILTSMLLVLGGYVVQPVIDSGFLKTAHMSITKNMIHSQSVKSQLTVLVIFALVSNLQNNLLEQIM